MSRVVWFVAVLALAGAAPSPTVRTWSDTSGQFKTEAELLEVSGDQVSLKKSDGLVVKVPLSRLSTADQAYVERWNRDSSKESAARPAASVRKTKSRQRSDLDSPPPLMNVRLNWSRDAAGTIAAGIGSLRESPFVTHQMLQSVQQGEHGPIDDAQRAWLTKTLAKIQPAVVASLKRDFQKATEENDLRTCLPIHLVARGIRAVAVPDSERIVGEIVARIASGAEVPNAIWRVTDAKGTRLNEPFRDGDFSYSARPGHRLVRVSAQVENCGVAADNPYIRHMLPGLKALLLETKEESKTARKKVSHLIDQDTIFLLLPPATLIVPQTVHPSCKVLRQNTVIFKSKSGEQSQFFIGSMVPAGTSFPLDLVFAVPEKATDLRLLVLGAAAPPVEMAEPPGQ